jgi:quinoprotein glucose dehydrogenase
MKREDLVTAEDTTPEHAKACQELWDKNGGYYNDGPFSPFLFHENGAAPRYSIQFPGGTGGASWGGLAVDPRSGYVFVQTHDTPLTGWVAKKKEGGRYENVNLPYDLPNAAGGGLSASLKDGNGRMVNLPCFRPPWSRILAVNANTGDIAWRTTLGTKEALPESKKNVGGAGSAGPIVTAGGLVFIGAAQDARFRAFDSKTGKELWATRLDRVANAVPITYQGRNRKQYVAVTATDTLVVFALP